MNSVSQSNLQGLFVGLRFSIMSLSARQFTAQLHEESNLQPRFARRIVVNADVLKAAKISTGDVVAISQETAKNYTVGLIWPSSEILPTNVSVSSSHLLTLGLQEGQPVRIVALGGTAKIAGLPSLKNAKDATDIRLKEIEGVYAKNSDKEKVEWLTLASREVLVDLKYIVLDQIIEVTFDGRQRRFCIASINTLRGEGGDVVDGLSRLSLSHNSPSQLWMVSWDTNVQILAVPSQQPSSESRQDQTQQLAHLSPHDAFLSVGGLSKQIEEIRDLLEIPLNRPDLFRHFGLKPPRGILLHGPPGTGKTHLARAIAASTQSSVLVINGPELSSAYHGETESKLRQVFKEAHAKSPCIVVLDEVDALVPRREDGAGGEVEKRVVATLLTILDGMADDKDDSRGKVVVVGTTNRPNAIDPALRRPGRFDREIEIGIPDAEARLSILKVLLSKTPHTISQEDLRSLASRAHGYVGADLSAVVREAGTISIKRWSKGDHGAQPLPDLQLQDLETALPLVRASAMRSVFVDAPPVKYSDIGGQASVIQKLREAVEWPLLHPGAFQRLGVHPPKGVLLYGPPGCSKTVLARACATESGINFVAVKGPELLNKFVGESERSVREIFRKARAASPSIIFFDEIDALATSRTSSESDSGSSHEGVLTSILNEMDGVQELVGVTVIAATNRPEAIDSALMRPGRLDRILYVGPPDASGREEILRIKLNRMTVAPDVDIQELAQLTEGCSGAEITTMCQEAALETMRQDINAPHVSISDPIIIKNNLKLIALSSGLTRSLRICCEVHQKTNNACRAPKV
ncbi:hypothetical protein H1R20_g3679, partial [Candolleomyces eurysporus]